MGIGWDLTLLGLSQHLSGAPALTPEDSPEWLLSAEGLRFTTGSGERRHEAGVAWGTDPAAARAATERVIAAYTAPPPQE